jgi:iron-sulfur cluster assembly protein
MNFEITPAAEKFIRLMLRADGAPGGGFRLVVSPGGCSGLAADINVLRAPAPGDAIVERNGVKLFLPAESRILLDGVTIDFADTASQTGLVFRDPKGTSCSSGSGGKTAQ